MLLVVFRLQQVLDLGTKLHGESNSLLDLAIAFIEEGRIKQATKIMQVSAGYCGHYCFSNYTLFNEYNYYII